MIAYYPRRFWSDVCPILKKDSWLARQLFLNNHALFDPHDRDVFGCFCSHQLGDIYLLLSSVLPENDKQNLTGGPVTPAGEIRRFRDKCIQVIVSMGSSEGCQALRNIIDKSDTDEGHWLKRSLRDSEQNRLRNVWAPPHPEHVVELRDNTSARLVRTESDLQQAVLEALSRYQEALRGSNPASFDLWNEKSGKSEPKDERRIASAIARFLENDLLGNRVIINREVDVGYRDHTDIHITACRKDDGKRITVVIEVKGSWNKDVDTAMGTQLKDQYLDGLTRSHGIFLVAWFPQEQWDESDQDRRYRSRRWGGLEDVRRLLSGQATGLSRNGLCIDEVVLDCSLPQK